MKKNESFENNINIASSIDWKHVISVTGALGSGKTEFTISLARTLATGNRDVVLADMDIINPYFCLRTLSQFSKQEKLSLLLPPGETKWGDMSFINPNIRTKIYDKTSLLILDVGGDSQGALSLKQFEREIKSEGYDLIFVINPYRTHTRTLNELSEMRAQLEEICGLDVTAVVANPHFMERTTAEESAKGITDVMSFAEEMNIPMLFGIAEDSIFLEVKKYLPKEILLWSLEREILFPWEEKEHI